MIMRDTVTILLIAERENQGYDIDAICYDRIVDEILFKSAVQSSGEGKVILCST